MPSSCTARIGSSPWVVGSVSSKPPSATSSARIVSALAGTS